MEKETIEYIESWNKKLEQIKKDDLNSLFDKFNTLYPIYNRLYNDIHRKNPPDNRIGDFVKATEFLRDSIGADIIIEKTSVNNKDIQGVVELINNKIFHINLADGIPQEANDEQLVKNLSSDNNDIKARAILSLIYNIRTNIVHGEKQYKEYQRLILEPVIHLIETMIKIMIEKLN